MVVSNALLQRERGAGGNNESERQIEGKTIRIPITTTCRRMQAARIYEARATCDNCLDIL
eukprot:CAMPEP_0194753622 /NCGR_PEP_ID=MMETSP0323_2-20130528/7586_1 /TAXON_ID=2866 ORGANISM="Crypthecodinium cohnii, Strain Seligo" /NCGR_SAMPLE_ID=MMETSP0323_2 /ASSEMBLY_ACC=CAM_ASM_000346 /LENGTH=59 /DNA_ID=CAMNT_0039671595 /DNA_START=72 /DNA_END=248 /DNA_ORIENTATION=-